MNYIVKSRLNHNGVVYAPDSLVEMDEASAKTLLKDGIIAKVKGEADGADEDVDTDADVEDTESDEGEGSDEGKPEEEKKEEGEGSDEGKPEAGEGEGEADGADDL